MGKTLLIGTGSLDFTAASTTSFVDLTGGFFARTANERRAQIYMEAAGTLRNLSVVATVNGRSTTTTVRLAVNGSASGLTTSFGAGITGRQTDAVNSAAVSVGDLVDVHVVTGASTGAFTLASVQAEFEAASGTVSYWTYNFNDAVAQSAAETSIGPVEGIRRNTIFGTSTTSDYRNSRCVIGAQATIQNLRVQVIAFSMDVNPTLTLYVNGVASALTVTITTTGVISDTTHTVSVAVGDYVEWRLNSVGRTTGSITLGKLQIEAVSATTKFDVFASLRSDQAPNNAGHSSSANYTGIAGRRLYTATEAEVGILAPFDVWITRLRAGALNNDGASYTARLRVAAANGSGLITLPNAIADTTYVVDATNTDAVTAGQAVDVLLSATNAASGLYISGLTLDGTEPLAPSDARASQASWVALSGEAPTPRASQAGWIAPTQSTTDALASQAAWVVLTEEQPVYKVWQSVAHVPYEPLAWAVGTALLPGSGEFLYDTIPTLGQRAEGPEETQNVHQGPLTDIAQSLTYLRRRLPRVTGQLLVTTWYGTSLDAAECEVKPVTTYPGGSFSQAGEPVDWKCSNLTQDTPDVPTPPEEGGNYVFGGTMSDQSVIRAVRYIRDQGMLCTFYPFIQMMSEGYPWRGRITAEDGEEGAQAVAAFMGPAQPADFTREADTVAYAGSDWGYRRMVLHYANLVVLAGGCDLFVIASEMRGMERIRGPNWTEAGDLEDGTVTWDYPFVDALRVLAADVRAVFLQAGLNIPVAYAADWSTWMGEQREDGQWPHLDQLYAEMDYVAFDNYMPLSDWTPSGGLDATYWSDPKPTTWPPSDPAMNGLGLTGTPTIYSKAYLQANIEGGEKFNWFYTNSENEGRGTNPDPPPAEVSLPAGDRLTQSRNRYYPGQEILANKQIRWWWNNYHRAVYDTGSGWVPQGAPTRWVPNSKQVIFTEFGFPSVDRATNQPNVFFDPKSVESFTPFWSAWTGTLPVQDVRIQNLALEAFISYWTGEDMIDLSLSNIWNYDVRPYPTFPVSDIWSDRENWPYGDWIK